MGLDVRMVRIDTTPRGSETLKAGAGGLRNEELVKEAKETATSSKYVNPDLSR